MILKPVATIENDFATKFGLPRQSGLGDRLISRVILNREFAREDCLRGIDEFSHLWLIWGFDVPRTEKATVRPPRLGGNEKRGIFATRSPFRPNPLGLSVVRLESVHIDRGGAYLMVSGADMKSGSPVYDIKPYLPYADAVENASGGFAQAHAGDRLKVCIPEELKKLLPPEKLEPLYQALSLDPRPPYQRDPIRIYGFLYAGRDVRFRVKDNILTVTEIVEV